MRISVIIPCHGGIQDTLAAIASLRSQRLESGYGLEILVVDNASPDATRARLATEPGVRVCALPENRGFAGGVNAGLHAATGNYLMVLNNDTLAAPRMMERLLQPHLQDARVGITAPVSNHVKGKARLEVGDLGASPEGRIELEETLHNFHAGQWQDLDSLSGLCLLMHRRSWERIGDFDEAFGHGNFEDDDFCLRARLLGLRLLVVRDAFLHHHGNRTFDALGFDYQQTLRDKQRVFAHKWTHDPVGQSWLASLADDHRAAAYHAGQALRRYPNWPDGLLCIARHHHISGRPHLSLPLLTRFLQVCPQHTEARMMQAFETQRAGDPRRGERLLREAMDDCYFSTEATIDVLRLQGSQLLEDGAAHTAAQRFAEALELRPEDPHLQQLLGTAQRLSGDPDAALAPLRSAAARGEAEPWVQLCAALFESGRSGEALTELLDCLQRHPDHGGAAQLAQQALAGLRSRGLQSGPLLEALAELSSCGAPAGP